MMFLLLACVGSKGPAADSIPTVETSTVDSGTDTDDTTTTPTDDTGTGDTGTPSAPCSADPIPATDPDCPEGVAALTGGVPYASVDEAIAAATLGATVGVCPGSWPTNATIRTPLTLRGRAGREATVLDGGGVGRVLTVVLSHYEAEVAVEGVTITGGETSEDGGGIYLDGAGALTVKRACVYANHAGRDGGGINGLGALSLTLGPDVGIEWNRAERDGGGVYANYTDDWVHDTTFVGNTAGGMGGGYYAGNGEIFVSDVVFERNVASSGGGAWYEAPLRFGSLAYFRRVTFLDNVASDLGGGLGMAEDGAGTSGVIEAGTFRGNIADVGGGLGNTSVYESSTSVPGTLFEGNSARLGGAIGGDVVTFDRAILVDNSATEAGGAVYAMLYAFGLGAVLEGNAAPVGGGIALDHGLLWLVSDFGTGVLANLPDDIALLVGGTAYDGLGAGAVVWCDDPDGCRFAPSGPAASADTEETADTGGTGTAAVGCDGTTAALIGSTAYATVGDAVVAAPSGATVDVCPGDWPAVLVVAGDLTLRGAGFETTSLDGEGDGPVISVEAGASLVVSDLSLHGGHAQLGGGLLVQGVVEAARVVAEGNTAADGGGIAVYGGDLTWTGGRIQGNTALGRGGGVSLTGGSLAVVGSRISGNLAADGGGIYALGGVLTLDASPLEDNVAGIGWGGGLAAYSLVARGVTATGNYAQYTGGGIYCDGCSLSEVVATGNAAGGGGGVYLDGGSLSASVVSGNVAISGGGLFVLDGIVEDTAILSNQGLSGGGVWSRDTTLTRVTLSENRAVDGGGLSVFGEATVADSSVTGNLADRGGGAWLGGGVLTSLTSDWGTGADENLPDDVASETSSEASYGAAASFTCDAATGVCE